MAQGGHRTVPHTADLRIEAWGGTREECVAEAVRGLVEGFADTSGVGPARTAERHVNASSDDDLLVAVMDEVIYRLDADGQTPVSVAVRPASDGGVDLVLALADTDAVEIVGAAPKAVSLHELRLGADSRGQWSCSVTVDV